MSDIELVIKMPEETYTAICNENMLPSNVINVIKNGAPLPKGQGRLIVLSENAIKREQTSLSFSCQNWISEVGLSNATVAIIDVDEEAHND